MYSELKQKVCPQCKIEKALAEFSKDATQSGGVSCWCKPCKKTWRQQHRKDNPEHYRAVDQKADLMKRYGMGADDYWKMFDEQKGCCGCCGQSHTLFKRGLHVDHDHSTGQVRALLCTECNPGLGYFQDSIDRLEMAITYLKKFKK